MAEVRSVRICVAPIKGLLVSGSSNALLGHFCVDNGDITSPNCTWELQVQSIYRTTDLDEDFICSIETDLVKCYYKTAAQGVFGSRGQPIAIFPVKKKAFFQNTSSVWYQITDPSVMTSFCVRNFQTDAIKEYPIIPGRRTAVGLDDITMHLLYRRKV
jgi:hypothetical protein